MRKREAELQTDAGKVLALEVGMTKHQQLITLEEFAAMTQDDDWKEELLDGVIRRFPLPNAPHGVACARLANVLGNYCHKSGFGQVSLGSGLVVSRNPDSVLGPDLQVFATHRPPDTLDGWPSVPPVLIAEVVDGPEDYSHIMHKIPFYLRFGVDLIWIVVPGMVRVYRLTQLHQPFDEDQWSRNHFGLDTIRRKGDELDGGDVLPGFSCKVSELFA